MDQGEPSSGSANVPETPPKPLGPVRLTGMASNAGWIVHVDLPEPARAIWYKRRGDAAFVSTGEARGLWDPSTDQPRPKSYFVLDDVRAPTPIAIRWQNALGETKGPVEVVFDPLEQSVAFVKSVLADLPAWVAFREYDGKTLVYFTTLVAYKFALREITYGIDAEPHRSLAFSPADVPGIADGDELYLALPPGARSVSVQLTFKDGSRSEVKRQPVRRE